MKTGIYNDYLIVYLTTIKQLETSFIFRPSTVLLSQNVRYCTSDVTNVDYRCVKRKSEVTRSISSPDVREDNFPQT